MRKPNNSTLLYRLRWLFWPYLLVVVAIVGLAYSGAIPTTPLRWPWSDKIMHFVLIGTTAFWLDLWLGARDLRIRCYRLPLAFLIVGGVALIEEAIQICSPERTADVLDAGADMAGIAVALFVSRWLQRRTCLNRDGFT